MDADPQELQQIEHSIRMKQMMLQQVRTQKQKLAEEEGVLQCEINNLENKRYALAMGRNPN